MNLNSNSFSARLYRWFYNLNDMPNNLCPYFWKLVIMYISIIPYVLFTIPKQIISGFGKDSIGNSIFVSGISYFIICFLVLLGIPIYDIFFKVEGPIWLKMEVYGIFFWMIIICVSLVFFCQYLYDKIKRTKPKENIIIETIKAKYNKVCPTINWDKND